MCAREDDPVSTISQSSTGTVATSRSPFQYRLEANPALMTAVTHVCRSNASRPVAPREVA
jgi:hypothetical protein